MTIRLCCAKFFWLLSLIVFATQTQAVRADLTIGSKAPNLDIEHWLSDGGGKLKPVTEFERGKVYVVEFWATWCGPCVASMPHIAELQKTMVSKGVQVVSVSDEDLDTVNEFLERTVPAGIAKSLQKTQPDTDSNETKPNDSVDEEVKLTFGELTAAYSLATDPDQSVYKDYMEASGESGIPTAFIVGKQGIIEWIGHPMELDVPLSQIVEDKWDREAYVKQRAQQKEVEQAVMAAYEKLQEGKTEEALTMLDELVEKYKGTEISSGLQALRIDLLLQIDPDKAIAGLKDALAQVDDPQALNGIAWSIVEFDNEGDAELSDDLLAAASAVAEKAAKLSPDDAAIIDTLAHLVYMQGDIGRAIELQTKAIKLEPDMEGLQDFLETLQQEKEDSK